MRAADCIGRQGRGPAGVACGQRRIQAGRIGIMLDKKMYLRLEKMLKEKDGPGKKDVLDSFQEELMYELTELYADGRKEELDKELHAFQRFGKLLRDGAGDSLSYQAGVIAGAAAAIGMLARKSSARDRFNRKMSALLQEEACRKILSYLYGHPGSQCRVIARDLGIQPDDLDRQLADLEEAGGVVHHGVDESSFYELTLDGQAFVEENRC